LLTVGLSQSKAEPRQTLVIDAVVVDRSGNPVTDLSREEVEVWISGYRVPIETFVPVTPADTDRAGRLIVLLLDDMVLPPQILPRGREVARRLVTRMGPDDKMAIVALNGDRMEPTDDRERLLRRIDSWQNVPSGVIPLDSVGEHVLQTVAALARGLAEAPGGRKTLVAIGAAWLFDTPIPPPTAGRDLRREWTQAMRAAGLANVSLYVVDPSGVGSSPVVGGASGFAGYTGGHAFYNTNDLTGAADQILREAGHYYLFGVADPPIQRKADLRELDVRVARRGVTVRARKAIPGSS
jgi:VWFA-related protein